MPNTQHWPCSSATPVEAIAVELEIRLSVRRTFPYTQFEISEYEGLLLTGIEFVEVLKNTSLPYQRFIDYAGVWIFKDKPQKSRLPVWIDYFWTVWTKYT
ncbi:MAG: hypothetical protein ACP5N7_00845 [Candidatus Pacearchaeota archaeon]